MGKTSFRALVHGRVQGVGFRYCAHEKARALGLTGWVRNLDSGDVETECEGPEAACAAYGEWLAHGPSGSRVDSVRREPLPYRGLYAAFTIES